MRTTERYSLFWIHVNEKTFLKKFEKPLDKPQKVWYNKITKREGKPTKPESEETL